MEAINELISDILDVVIERVVISEPDPGTKGRIKGKWYRRKNGLVRKWMGHKQFSCYHGRWYSSCKICHAAKTCEDGYKACTMCGQARALSEYIVPPRKREGRACRACLSKDKKRRDAMQGKYGERRLLYAKFREESMSKGCCVPGCFGKDDPHMLRYGEFDHVGEKRFGMAKWPRSASLTEDDLRDEASKCRPICRFHHRIHSAEQRSAKPQVEASCYGVAWKQKRRGTLHSMNNAVKQDVGACIKCGRVVVPGEECGFDWDHIDPSTKRRDVSQFIMNCNSWVTILTEIKKCELKCACCHSEEPSSRCDFSN